MSEQTTTEESPQKRKDQGKSIAPVDPSHSTPSKTLTRTGGGASQLGQEGGVSLEHLNRLIEEQVLRVSTIHTRDT